MESDLFHPHAPHIIENNRRRTPQWKAYVCWLDSLECRAHRNAESGSCLPQILCACCHRQLKLRIDYPSTSCGIEVASSKLHERRHWNGDYRL